MPIQRYDIPAASFSVPRIATPSFAPQAQMGREIAQFAGVIQSVTNQIADGQARRAALKEHNLLAEREMRYVSQMDNFLSTMSRDGSKHADAGQHFSQFVSQVEPQIYEGLTDDQRTKLRTSVFPQQLKYSHQANSLEDKAQLARGAATFATGADMAVNHASRMDVPDSNAFEFFHPGGKAEQIADNLVAMGLWGPDDKIKEIETAKKNAAYARAATLAETTPEVYKKLWDQELKKPGSTYLSEMNASHRVNLHQSAVGSLHSQLAAQEKAAKDALKQAQDAVDNELYAMHVDKQLTVPEIMKHRHILGREKTEHLVEMVQRPMPEGPGDPETANRLKIETYGQLYPGNKTADEIKDQMLLFQQSGGTRGIRPTDGVAMLQRIRGSQREAITEGRAERSEDRIAFNETKRQGFDQLMDALTPTGPFGKLETDQSQALKNAARMEWDGLIAQGVDGMTAARTLIPKYQGRLPSIARRQINVLSDLNTFKDEASLKAAYKAGQISKAQAMEEFKRFKYMKELNETLMRTEEATKSAGGGGSTPGSAPKPTAVGSGAAPGGKSYIKK